MILSSLVKLVLANSEARAAVLVDFLSIPAGNWLPSILRGPQRLLSALQELSCIDMSLHSKIRYMLALFIIGIFSTPVPGTLSLG